MDSRARRTAETLLDFYAGFAASESLLEQEAAFHTSMRRLNEIDAIEASADDDGNLSLDFLPVLLAAGTTYQWLFDRLSRCTGTSEEELAFELRNFLDEQEENES